MYSPLKNPITDPLEVRLRNRGRFKKCACVILVIVCSVCLLDCPPVYERDLTDTFFLQQGLIVPPILVAAIIVHEVILFSEEFFIHKKLRHEGRFLSVCSATFKHSIFALPALALSAFLVIYFSESLLKSWNIATFCFFWAVILGSLEGLRSPSDAALNSLLKQKHLSQVWAESAFTSYYSKVLEDFVTRATEFERIHEVTLAMKKLILVIPLSCNVSGAFDNHHPDIEYLADLPSIINDQGANMNRIYKNPVYKVTFANKRPFYLAMEQPSSILMICRLKNHVAEDILHYQRDSFILKMQEKFEDHPGVVVVYDDTNLRGQVPLAEFLYNQVFKQVEEIATGQM